MPRQSGVKQFLCVFVCTVVAVLIVRQTEFVEHIAYRMEKGRLRALAEKVPDEALIDQLQTPSRTVADLITPAVVHIETKRRVNVKQYVEQMSERDKSFAESHPFLDRINESGEDTYVFDAGLGSGFVVDADSGYIVTNHHVTEDADIIEVILYDGRRFEATVVGDDPQSDLAVLHVDADRLHQAKFGDSTTLAVGDDVFSLGNPFGLHGTFSRGIISGLDRSNIAIGDVRYRGFIQTDAVINPGNSGGPLVNLRGEVIGVNTAIASESGTYSGVGFAIPASRVVQLLPQLISGERVVRGYLGIGIGDVHENRETAQRLGWNKSFGVIVGNVVKNGPADLAGMRPEDIIVAIEDIDVGTTTALMDVVAGRRPGTTVSIRFWRGDGFQTVDVRLTERPGDI